MKTTSDCIGIREYLLRRRLQPHHETATHGMFLSPLREERTPSFSVRYDKGLWYDFGLGEGGTLLQLVMRLEGCSMAEAIRSLRKEIRRRSSLPAPPDRLAARRLPAADPRRRGDSPPGADRLSARARHRPRRGRSAVPRGPLRRRRTAFLRHRLPQRCRRLGAAQPAIQGEQRPEIHHDLRPARRHGAALRGLLRPALLPDIAAQGDANRRHRRTQLRGQPSPRPSVSRTPHDDPRLPRQRRGGAPHPRTAAQRPARCDRHRPGGELPQPTRI